MKLVVEMFKWTPATGAQQFHRSTESPNLASLFA